MAEELGSLAVKIGLDSSGFQNGISSINRNLRVLDSEFKANTAALGENSKGLEGLRLKSQSLSKQLELQKQRVTVLDQAYTKSAQTKGRDSRATQELEIKLNRAKQSLSQMEGELSRTNKEIEVQSSRWTALGKSLDGVGNKMKSIGDGLTGAGSKLSLAVTAPLVAAGAASIRLASDTSESMNKVEVAFGSVNQSVKNWSDTTLKSYGIAKGTALDMSALYGDMATSMGLNQREAAKMSMSLVGLAGDLSSFKNIDIKQAEEALNGIFTGETESLKMLGIVMTDTNLQQYAYSKGIQKKTQDMTEAEKVQLRYNYVMDKTKNSHGDFERTSAGTANQMRVFQESLKELGATMGQNILPIITPIIARLNEWIQAFGKLDKGSQRIILVIGAVIAAIGPALVGIGSVVRAVGDISTAIGKVSTAAGKLGGMSKILGMVFNPWVIGIGLAIFAGYEIYKHWDVISQGAAQLWNNLTAVFENIKMSVSGAWENVKTATLTAWETLKNTVSSGLNSIKIFLEPALNFYRTIFQNTWDIIKNVVLGAVLIIFDIVTGNFTKLKSDTEHIWTNIKTALTNIWETIKNTAVNAWTRLKESVTSLCSSIKETVINIWNSVLSWFSELPGKLYNYGSSMFTRMRDGVKSTIGSVRSSIEGGINSALSYLAGLPGRAWSYGVDFVNGIVNGIRSAIGRVEDAVSALAAKIRSYLHFSVPDEGPLTDYESWMPDFMEGLAEGINRSRYLVSDAVNRLSLDMKVSPEVSEIPVSHNYSNSSEGKGNISSKNGLTLYIENFNNYTEKDIEQLAYELEFYRQKTALGKGGV
ncbi:phage tail tape measure protein [Clostridium tyrobutyricum]|uniref:phage tail tape measure protein n=1 Tax=Clostridium tyrobutyricum TaxID=1519 RepID=UPI00057FDF2A|nr:phage tail tape measure protein [Clostridium tyrobutyricum]MBR9648592.1 phage tail tape measure protein [Clostridium tyrobutyricum]